jgi:hypothetical protein
MGGTPRRDPTATHKKIASRAAGSSSGVGSWIEKSESSFARLGRRRLRTN